MNNKIHRVKFHMPHSDVFLNNRKTYKIVLEYVGAIVFSILSILLLSIVVSDIYYAMQLPFKDLGITDLTIFIKTVPWVAITLFGISAYGASYFIIKKLYQSKHNLAFSNRLVIMKITLVLLVLFTGGLAFTQYTNIDNSIENNDLIYKLSTFKNFTDDHIIVGAVLVVKDDSIIVQDSNRNIFEVPSPGVGARVSEDNSISVGDSIAVHTKTATSDLINTQTDIASSPNSIIGAVQEVKEDTIIIQDVNRIVYEIPKTIAVANSPTLDNVVVGDVVVIKTATAPSEIVKNAAKQVITTSPPSQLSVPVAPPSFIYNAGGVRKTNNFPSQPAQTVVTISATDIDSLATGPTLIDLQPAPVLIVRAPIVVNPVIPQTKPKPPTKLIPAPVAIVSVPKPAPVPIPPKVVPSGASVPVPVVIAPLRAPDADVIVVGSSLAGWAATMSAATEGSSVILVSETPCIGGQATCAGVSTWDDTWVKGAGGPWGLDKKLQRYVESKYRYANVRLGGCYSPVPNTNTGRENFVEGDRFCPHPDRLEDGLRDFINVLKKYGGKIQLKYADVYEIKTNGIIRSSIGDLRGKVVIEATETGELIPASLRRSVNPSCKQQITYVAGIRNRSWSGSLLSSFSYPMDPGYKTLLEDWWTNSKYYWASLTGQQGLPVYRRTHDTNGELVIYLNWMNDATNKDKSYSLTSQMLNFLKTKGYGNWIYGFRKIPYIRTSDYRLNGQTHLGSTPRGSDSFASSVSVAGYRADYHGSGCSTGIEGAEPYGIYDVPAGIGIPAVRVPILVAMPRSGDISDLRASSLRMQPDEIGFGEAMGVVAEIAAKKNILPQDVNIAEVRSLLIARGAKIDAN